MAGPFAERRGELRSPFRSWRIRDRFMPGVEVHATQMLNLLRSDWLSRPAAFETGVVLLAALTGAGLFCLRPVPASFVTLGLMALVMASAAALFQGRNLWFPWLVPVAVQWPLGLGGAVLFHSIEWRRLRRRLEAAKKQDDGVEAKHLIPLKNPLRVFAVSAGPRARPAGGGASRTGPATATGPVRRPGSPARPPTGWGG